MKDWKLIFNTKSYYYILVHENIKENYLKFFFEHQEQIESVDSFSFMMPTKEDLEKMEKEDYILRFGRFLKPFMDDPNKKTLFIEEDILKSIVKEDKLANFFKLLSKSNKNIVLFYYSDIDNYISKDFSSLYLTEKTLETQYSLFDRFVDIKSAIDKTHNPFKDPISAFNKIQNDNTNNESY